MVPTAEISKSPVPQEAFERFPGRWIALRNGEIIADAETREELQQDDRVDSKDALYRVPEPSTHFYRLRLV
jgi:hypothetical protein